MGRIAFGHHLRGYVPYLVSGVRTAPGALWARPYAALQDAGAGRPRRLSLVRFRSGRGDLQVTLPGRELRPLEGLHSTPLHSRLFGTNAAEPGMAHAKESRGPARGASSSRSRRRRGANPIMSIRAAAATAPAGTSAGASI